MVVARFYNRQCIRSQYIWKRYIKEAPAQLSEESDNVSNINNAAVNRIIEVWSVKSYFWSMTNKKCIEIHFTAFISLAHDNFTLKIAKKILRCTICNLMALLPLSHDDWVFYGPTFVMLISATI